MWTREELKNRARNVLSGNGGSNYWSGVVACLLYGGLIICAGFAVGILFAIAKVVGLAGAHFSFWNVFGFWLSSWDDSVPVYTGVINLCASIALSIMGVIPFTIGLYRYFINLRQRNGNLQDLAYSFNGARYLPIVASVAWMVLFLSLWQLIYIVPNEAVRILLKNELMYHGMLRGFLQVLWGIASLALIVPFVIKMIEYSMTPYILTDNPHIGYRRALKLSMKMTQGCVGQIFVLGLSFLGWILLGIVCCLVGVVFVTPYIQATYAELYARLRDNALQSGACSYAELNFRDPRY